jgi:hypothetical protein
LGDSFCFEDFIIETEKRVFRAFSPIFALFLLAQNVKPFNGMGGNLMNQTEGACIV